MRKKSDGMEITLLIKSIIGLVFVLGFLIFLMIFSSNNKKNRKEQITLQNTEIASASKTERMKTDLESLRAIIKDKKSDKHTLREALELVIKYHGTIPKKLGIRAHPDFEIYRDIIMTLCRHPNTNKYLVLYLDKNLTELNSQYKVDINDALTSGLNSRGY